jgi:hypothetical protein
MNNREWLNTLSDEEWAKETGSPCTTCISNATGECGTCIEGNITWAKAEHIFPKIDFDLEAFKRDEFVVNCRTEEAAKAFCDYLHECGMEWIHGKPYAHTTQWNSYKSETCYDGNGTFADTNYYNGDIPIIDFNRLTLPLLADTQEKIDADAGKKPCEYFGTRKCIECPASDKPSSSCEKEMTLDLLRRQRELDARK